MRCHSCKQKSVIQLPNSEVFLCKNHFNNYFERKVRKTIRVYKLIEKNDKVGVAVSGGKDSLSLLYILNKIFKPTKVKLFAIAIDEGIDGYRDPSFKYVNNFCKNLKIPLKTYSFKYEIGQTLDQITKKDKKTIPCTYCGVFRRKILNDKALDIGLDKLATGHNLDDEAQSILMNQFRRNMRAAAILGPKTGVIEDEKFVKRIKPFYFLTEKEITAFAFLNGILDKYAECPNAKFGYRRNVQELLNDFEKMFPGTKHNIVRTFLASKHHIKYDKDKSLRACKVCGSATSQETCQSCVLLEGIK